MISLAGGLPNADLFPLAELSAIAQIVIGDCGGDSLQYSPTSGVAEAREALSSLFGGAVTADQVVVTTGSQQGIDLLARTLIDRGDPVVVSDPEYLGTLQVLRSHGASLSAIPSDQDGLDTDRLEARLTDGLRPKACYLVPHFHNPTGAVISAERRRHLDDLSTTYGFVIIEDDPYRDLFYDTDRPPPTDPHPLTVSLRSTSKVLAPGLRVGAMSGPAWLLNAVTVAKQSTDLHTSGVSQLIAAEALRADWYPAHVAHLRHCYGAKRDLLVNALEHNFSDQIEFATPAGGMFLWARFLAGTNTDSLLVNALEMGTCFVPGSAFAVDRDLADHARLSFVTASATELEAACSILAAAAAS